jgi:glycosyltransferase involved in cell wall biosynthesis
MIKNRKKVLIIFRDSLSKVRGTPLRVKSLVKEMSEAADVELFTATQDESSSFNAVHLKLGFSNLTNLLRLQKFIRENKIDVVVFHTIAAGYFLIPLLFFGGKYKRVLEMHGFFEEEARLYSDISFIKYHRNKFVYSIIYRMCHLITTCSDTASEKLLKYNKNTHTIFGGVDLDLFKPDAQEVTDILSPDDSRIIIGYAGNARKWQGIEFLIDAFRKLHDRDPSFSLKMLLSEKVNHLDMSGITVYQALPHDEVGKFINECDILVIPRLHNEVNRLSFPSKLMEYLATGKPVVGSKTSDMHKIIVHEESGMLYEPGNIEDFIMCMLQLKATTLRSKVGRKGLDVAKAYTWQIQGRKFTNLIKACSD